MSQRSVAALRMLLPCGFVALMGACKERALTPHEQFTSAYAAAARPVQARLAGYPFTKRAATRGDSAAAQTLQLQSAAYAVLANRPADAAPIAEWQRFAAAQIVTSRAADAVASLAAVVARSDSNARVWNDYAVALFESARKDGDARTIASSLAAADRALALTPLPEAKFNRALILDALELRTAAADAWRAYLTIDNASAWATEARAALERDEQPTQQQQWDEARAVLETAAVENNWSAVDRVLRVFGQQARTWGEGEYLSRWAACRLSGDQAAARRWLAVARAIGERLATLRNERLLYDAVAAIEANADATVLARAHLLYADARKLIHGRRPGEAEPLLISAEVGFRNGRSPMELVARYYRAGAAFDRRDRETALHLLDQSQPAAHRRYRALEGQVLWERARIAGRAGDLHACLTQSTTAALLFEDLGEMDFATKNRTTAASMLFELGRPAEAWRVRHELFRRASDSGSASALQLLLHASARDEIQDDRADVARSLLQILLKSDGHSPLLSFDALLWSTFLDHRAGKQHDVDATAATVRAAATRIADAGLRAEALDQARFCEALLEHERDPRRAVALFDEIVAFRRHAGRPTRIVDAYRERARALVSLRRTDEAVQDLAAALNLLEQQRHQIAPADLRDTFFSSANAICKDLVDLRVASGSYETALQDAERCRATVLDVVAADQERPRDILTIAALQSRLSEQMAVAHYTSLRDRVVVHIVAPKRAATRIMNVDSRTLARLAEETPRNPRSARELWTHLIRPIIEEVGVPKKLLIVPDEALAGVSFAALQDERGTPLAVATELTLVPTAASVMRGGVPAATPRPSQALIIGDPALNTTGLDLPRLPGAAAEARAIAGLYRNARVLVGREATPERVTEEAIESDLVHIGAHVTLSARDARNSALHLAASAEHDGTMPLHKIAQLPLRKGASVILAGCSTGALGGGRGSIRSLAYAFLAGGSRFVVASLWDVDDELTRYFSVALHRRLSMGIAPAAALRETQLEMLASTDPKLRDPAAWGAFHLYASE